MALKIHSICAFSNEKGMATIMKNDKKILSLILALLLFLGLMPSANALSFTDNATAPPAEKYQEAVDLLQKLNILTGFEDGSFRPTSELTRAQYLKMLYVVINGGKDDKGVPAQGVTVPFTDIKSGEWFEGYIKFAYGREWVAGRTATTFVPDGNVTGFEALKLSLVALGYSQGTEGFTGDTWQDNVRNCAQSAGLLNSLASEDMSVPIAREVAAQMLYNTLLAKMVTYSPNIVMGDTMLYSCYKLNADDPLLGITTTHFLEGPIIYPELDASLGDNIQGPSLIKVPDWLENPLGKYYLYFADHKGDRIKLAFADDLAGPWTIYVDGSLHLTDTTFLHDPPELKPEMLEGLKKMAADQFGIDPESELAQNLLMDAITPHIASPEVIIDNENHRFIMYFHGLSAVGVQTTRLAISEDGVHFTTDSKEDLGTSYMRVFNYGGYVYAVTMPGQFYRSVDGISGFEPGPQLFSKNLRHHAVLLRDDTLYVFYTQVGDAPEQIYVSSIDVSKPWEEWVASKPILVMKPEYDWEGADAPLVPSIRSVAHGHVNQLRDPYIYEEGGKLYMLYSVAGESGIGIVELALGK